MRRLCATLLLMFAAAPALAESDEALEIWRRSLEAQGSLPFRGERHFRVDRGTPYTGRIQLDYADKANFSAAIEADGATASPLEFGMQQGQTWARFPDEGLFFDHGDNATRLIPAQLLLDQLPAWPVRRQPAGYSLTKIHHFFVALNDCHVLEFMPEHGDRARVRFYISKQNYQVLRVTRSHDLHSEPLRLRETYFDSVYRSFRTQSAPKVKKPYVSGGVQVDLSSDLGNGFRTYPDAATAASAENIRIFEPAYLPAGFALQQVQVLRVFGVPIQILTYSDGINLLMVCSQPEIDLSRLLFSGLVNLNYFAITQRMVGLKPFAPYDYFSRFTPAYQTIVFGDLRTSGLQRVSNSLSVP